jgi:hypothetical protein
MIANATARERQNNFIGFAGENYSEETFYSAGI